MDRPLIARIKKLAREENGAASVEAALLVPFAIAIFFLITLQLALTLMTLNAAQAAAEHGADAVATRDGTEADGQTVVASIMNELGYTSDYTSTSTVNGGEVVVTVTAQPITLLKSFTVTAKATKPVEEFLSAEQRQ